MRHKTILNALFQILQISIKVNANGTVESEFGQLTENIDNKDKTLLVLKIPEK